MIYVLYAIGGYLVLCLLFCVWWMTGTDHGDIYDVEDNADKPRGESNEPRVER